MSIHQGSAYVAASVEGRDVRARDWAVWAYAGFLTLFVLGVWARSTPKLFDDQGWLYKWQALEAGVIALVAAGVTAAVVLYQTSVAASGEQIKQRNREIATRARLPHILDALLSYTEACMASLNSAREQAAGPIIPNGITVPSPPTLSNGLVEQLADALEHCGDAPRESLASLLVGLQIQKARFTSYMAGLQDSDSGHIIGTMNIDSLALGTASLYAYASVLYPYARRQSEGVPPEVTRRMVYDALSSLRYRKVWDEELWVRFLEKADEAWRW